MVDAPERRIGRVVSVVTLVGSDVDVWWEQFRVASGELDGEGGMAGFRSKLAEAAGERGLRTAAEIFEQYLNYDSSVDESLLKAVAALGAGLAEIYRTIEPFSWISDASWDSLDNLWPRYWPSVLDEQLTARWGDAWQEHPDEHKCAWLDNLIPEFVYGPAIEDSAAEATPAESTAAEPAPDPGVVAAQAKDLILRAVARFEAENPGVTVPPEVADHLFHERASARR
ncbi:hypothetical protein AB0E69_04185 [Kribbella sp. NPDC026611]|uniref:hypothetical protein n=1 Tax=Kribbella sp. NPDC026611 TaxID=3154911 RepID=UPI0033CBC929